MLTLGIDTSNYTTSAAVFDSETMMVIAEKKLLPVKHGEAGLRQSDAVFHHTRQLPEIFSALRAKNADLSHISAIGVSSRPRLANGSYMPCFLCGEGLASTLGSVMNVQVYKTSHQIGHILAALYSAKRLDLLEQPFLAFHVSGGTTDCLYCIPSETVIDTIEVGSSLDLKAGQLIDRTGLMLGLSFPCGAQLERLALSGHCSHTPKAVLKNGSCCLSGFENKAAYMLSSGATKEDIALYILNVCAETIYSMTAAARKIYGELPVIFAGGVMSNKHIKGIIEKRLADVYFSEPEYSCDNAAGAAIYPYIMDKNLKYKWQKK